MTRCNTATGPACITTTQGAGLLSGDVDGDGTDEVFAGGYDSHNVGAEGALAFRAGAPAVTVMDATGNAMGTELRRASQIAWAEHPTSAGRIHARRWR